MQDFMLVRARLSSVPDTKVVPHPQGVMNASGVRECNEGVGGDLYFVIDRRYETLGGGFSETSTTIYAVDGRFPLDAADCNVVKSAENPFGVKGKTTQGYMKKFENLTQFPVTDRRTGEVKFFTHATLPVFEGQSEEDVRQAFEKNLIARGLKGGGNGGGKTKQEELADLLAQIEAATNPGVKAGLQRKADKLTKELAETPAA